MATRDSFGGAGMNNFTGRAFSAQHKDTWSSHEMKTHAAVDWGLHGFVPVWRKSRGGQFGCIGTCGRQCSSHR